MVCPLSGKGIRLSGGSDEKSQVICDGRCRHLPFLADFFKPCSSCQAASVPAFHSRHCAGSKFYLK